MKNLLQSLLEMNPKNRISWDEFFNHKIFGVSKGSSSKKMSQFSKEIFENKFKQSKQFFDIQNDFQIHQKNQSYRDIFSYAQDGMENQKIQESYFMSIKNTPKTKKITTFTPTRKNFVPRGPSKNFTFNNNKLNDNDDKKTQKRINERTYYTNNEYFNTQNNSNRENSPFIKSNKIQKYYSNDKTISQESNKGSLSNNLNQINSKNESESIF